jgi:hypothetical protein
VRLEPFNGIGNAMDETDIIWENCVVLINNVAS